MNEIISIPQLFIAVFIVWIILVYVFWEWWTKVFHKPFFSYDMILLMAGIGLVLTRISGYIAANISDNLAIFQIDFSRITQITDLQLNYLIIPLIPILAYQFWVMSIELRKGWQTQTVRLFQFGQLLSLPVLIFQTIRVMNASSNVLGYFIAMTVLNLLTVTLLEVYVRRKSVWLKSGMIAILGWSIVVAILTFGFTPYAVGEMVVNIFTQVLLTIAVMLPYFSRKQRLPVDPILQNRRPN